MNRTLRIVDGVIPALMALVVLAYAWWPHDASAASDVAVTPLRQPPAGRGEPAI